MAAQFLGSSTDVQVLLFSIVFSSVSIVIHLSFSGHEMKGHLAFLHIFGSKIVPDGAVAFVCLERMRSDLRTSQLVVSASDEHLSEILSKLMSFCVCAAPELSMSCSQGLGIGSFFGYRIPDT